MTVWWHWATGAWRWFRPGWCSDCGRWALVFRSADDDAGRCEQCWLDLK